MTTMLKIDSAQKGLLKLDARTILVLLVLGNVAVFLLPTMFREMLLIAFVFALALLTGVYRFSVKMLIAYIVLLVIDYTFMMYFQSGFAHTFALGARYMRKIFPCAVLGSILILTIQVSEFMAALSRMRTPRSIIIPLTVMLRYLPAIGEDRRQIKKALRMRDISPGILNFFRHPARTVECVYVPLLMSGSRRADELSSAAVTRGIENPKHRTSMHDVRFRITDLVCVVLFAGYVVWIVVV